MFSPIDIHYDNKPIYKIHFTESYNIITDVLSDIGCINRKVCIVADSNVAKHYIDSLASILTDKGVTYTTYVFEAGENNKNTDTVGKMYEHLIVDHFDRNDIILALGGGVTGDMSGFCAATYLRGIKFIQLPTSLLAMVDSSIGGKTGVDHKGYKNMVGAFHMPSAVITNTLTLNTLPDREFYSGFAEIIKHGLIADKEYYDYLYNNAEAALKRDRDVITQIIYRSCQIKQSVVEEDPTEKGIRAYLNFGHTIGHAIEKYMDFRLLHGECVALGCVASLYISFKRGLITGEEYENATLLFKKYNLPVRLSDEYNIDNDTIISITKSDKKADGNVIKFILLKNIGEAYIDRTVTTDEMNDALNILK